MASLATNFCATVFLVPLGLRRLFCCSSLYLKDPSLFRSKTWYLSDQKWKNLDLYILTVALPIACFSEILIFLSFSGHPTYRFSFLHQSLVLFLYWVLTILFLVKDGIDPLVINDSFLFVFAGIVFLVEYSMIGKGIVGVVGGVAYGLCGELALLCGFCCLILAVRPRSFFAEFCMCSGFIFKGTWFLQIGLCLFTDVFAFKGCKKIEVLNGSQNAELKCELEEDGLRGVAMVNLMFVGHAILVLLASLGVLVLLSSNKRLRHGEASGPLLAGVESESSSMRALPELELE